MKGIQVDVGSPMSCMTAVVKNGVASVRCVVCGDAMRIFRGLRNAARSMVKIVP